MESNSKQHPKPRDESTGELVIRTIAMPKDTNANWDIFGGWLVSQMDLGGAIAAKNICHGRVVTVAIDDVVFFRKVAVGDTVCCYAHLLKVGRTSMSFRVEAWVVPMDGVRRFHATEGVFTYVAIDEGGRPRPVKTDQ